MMFLLVLALSWAPQTQAQTGLTYTYTSSAFNVTSCGGPSLIGCPSVPGNIIASVTLNSAIPAGYSGAVLASQITAYSFTSTVTAVDDVGNSFGTTLASSDPNTTLCGNLIFFQGAVLAWNVVVARFYAPPAPGSCTGTIAPLSIGGTISASIGIASSPIGPTTITNYGGAVVATNVIYFDSYGLADAYQYVQGGLQYDISFSIFDATPSQGVWSVISGSTGKTDGNPSKIPGLCGCGDPINVSTGAVYEKVTDYETTATPNKIGFTRYYNSVGNATTFATSLGKQWRSTYDRYLHISPASGQATSIVAERADGQTLNFTFSNGAWISENDVDVSLVQAGGSWVLTDHDDTVETYSQSASGVGALNTITARNGYAQTLYYNSTGQLTSVTDSYNRTLLFTYQNGLLQTLTTPDNPVFTYGYASSGLKPGVLDQLSTVAYSTTPATSQTYTYGNRTFPFALTGITDENGNRFATWAYDSLGRGLSSQHAGGADLTTIAYNDTDGSRAVTNALGESMVFKFTWLQAAPKITEIDRLATATTAAAKQLFTYDSNGYVASQTDWNGNLTTYVNDVHGQPTTITEASGTPLARTTTITYHATFHLPTQIVTPGLTTTFNYDGSGNLLTKTQTDTTTSTVPYATSGNTRTWTYTWANGLLASVQSPRTDVQGLTKYTYDSSSALTATTNALGQSAKITQHLPGGLPQTIVDPNGVTTNLAYDARLRLLSSTIVTAAGPLTTKYVYDPAGNLLTTTLPDGSALTNNYDPAHRLTGVTDLFNQSIAYALDANGDRTLTNVLDANGKVQRKHSGNFDALGRTLQDIGGAGQITAFTYDGKGNATQVTDPRGNATQQVYDALNRPTQTTDAAGSVTIYSYDAHDRPLSVIDPNGITTTYVYDGFGDLIQQVSPVTGKTVYRYDANGNRTQCVDARGATANFTYDAIDRVTAINYPAASAENVAYAYDQTGHGFGIGRLTSVTDAAGTLSRSYDERGNILTEARKSGTVTLQTSYGYDTAGRVNAITYPSGLAVIYAFDIMGRVTAVNTQAKGASKATPAISGITYQPFGPVSGFTFANGVTDARTFDADYRINSLADTGKKPAQNLTYGYDAGNNVLTITDGLTPGNSQNFGYDQLNRLTSATGAYGNLNYKFDALGNRVSDIPPSTAGALDGIGTITGFTYNQSGRLSAVSAGGSQIAGYTYDAFGQRLAKSGTSATLYQYDLSGHLLEETDGKGNDLADYIYLGGLPVAVLQPSSGQTYFLHADRLGTPQVATDINQVVQWVASFDPFGTTTTGVGLIVQDLRLPGQEFDQNLGSGVYHNGFRDYVPQLGRYFQSDPIGLSGGWNRFVYVSGNPTKRFDRRGLQWEEAPQAAEELGALIEEGVAVLETECTSLANSIQRTFSSTDPLVGDLANNIEANYPGLVQGVNVPLTDAEGNLLTDADILLQNAVIQVKSGQSAQGLLRQLQTSETLTGLPSIGYAPNLPAASIRALSQQGGFVTGNQDTIIQVVKP